MMPPDELAVALRAACRDAGAAVLALRGRGLAVDAKPDGSPVSEADRAASRLLRDALLALAPGVPVVCEEGEQDPGAAERFWLVDPLDGTREFLRGSARFTLNIALLQGGRPLFGMIHAPVSGETWWGGAGSAAFRDGQALRTRALPVAPRVLLSPAEPLQAPHDLLARVLARWPAADCVPAPGALKFCELAAGRADLHPRSVPCCAWDSAAGQAILEGAGGVVLDARGEPLDYSRSPPWRNPAFLAAGDASVDWRALLRA